MFQSRDPSGTQAEMCDGQGLPSWKHENVPPLEKSGSHVTGQLPKNPFCPVPENGTPEPPAHHDSNLRRGRRKLIRDQIEEWSLKPAAGSLDAFDIGMSSEKQLAVRRRPAHAG